MKKFIFAALCVTHYAVLASAQEITFRDHGKIIKQIAIQDLSKVTTLQTITVWDPNEEAEISFEAFPTGPIFENVYGKEWLRKWINDPRSIRFKTGMPGLN